MRMTGLRIPLGLTNKYQCGGLTSFLLAAREGKYIAGAKKRHYEITFSRAEKSVQICSNYVVFGRRKERELKGRVRVTFVVDQK